MFKFRADGNDFGSSLERKFKKFDRNLLFYFLGLAALTLIFHSNLNAWWQYFLLEIALAGGVVVVVLFLEGKNHPIFRFFRYWYVVFSLPFLYWNIGPYIHLIFRQEFDPHIIAIDRWLFGVLPNIWVQRLVNPILTEIMQLSYSVYWVTIPLGLAVFYRARRYTDCENLLHYITLTFFLSYAFFILIPVAGPRFFIADQITVSYQGLFFAHYLREFVQSAGLRGGAFPSSHVGVATVILIYVWNYRPRLAITVFLPLVVALSLATIYGQYHYFTDVLVGLLMGLSIGFRAIRFPKSQPKKQTPKPEMVTAE